MDRVSACRILLILLALTGPAVAQPEPTRAPEQPSWYASAQRFVPPGAVAGTAIRSDETKLTGILPVFPAGADDPKQPGNAFERGQVLEVELRRNGSALEAVAAMLRPREPDETGAPQGTSDADLTRQFIELNRAVETKFKNLPPGTMPCDFGGYSIDRDPKGLNVRAEPSAQARVLGTLPPPYKFKSKGENVPDGGWCTEFTVIGTKNGWFLIQGAKPPGQHYEDERSYPKNHPKPYAGRGWVAGNKIGANFANGQTRMGGLFQAPNADAKWTRVTDRHGGEISGDGSPDRILACSGLWVLVEKHGARGWWRHLCSNQVTNCS
jgi:hypothetical protein